MNLLRSEGLLWKQCAKSVFLNRECTLCNTKSYTIPVKLCLTILNYTSNVSVICGMIEIQYLFVWQLFHGSYSSHTLQPLPPVSQFPHFTCSWRVNPQRWIIGTFSGHQWWRVSAARLGSSWAGSNRKSFGTNVQVLLFSFVWWFHLCPPVNTKNDTSFCNINWGKWKNW